MSNEQISGVPDGGPGAPPRVTAHDAKPLADHESGKGGNVEKAIGDRDQREGTPKPAAEAAAAAAAAAVASPELDDFGLPVRPRSQYRTSVSTDEFQSADEGEEEARDTGPREQVNGMIARDETSTPRPPLQQEGESKHVENPKQEVEGHQAGPDPAVGQGAGADDASADAIVPATAPAQRPETPTRTRQRADSRVDPVSPISPRKARPDSLNDPKHEIGGVSEWSHQALAPPKEHEVEAEEELGWQAMTTDGQMDYYDDYGHLVAKGQRVIEDEYDSKELRGGAGKGYTRVLLDEDAQSATSMDEHTSYLFKNKGGGTTLVDEDEDVRDPLAQMQETKNLLTEGQRIAYVGVTRLSMEEMKKDLSRIEVTKKFKKELTNATEAMQMWAQKMMVRLYAHMDISTSEQVMIEQLAEHGIQPTDMTQALMQNATVRNPMRESSSMTKDDSEILSPRTSSQTNGLPSDNDEEPAAPAPPPYTEQEKNHVPEAVDPSTISKDTKLDIDLRWTVLCDLFLVLIADSVYDARSRVLLETVGNALEVPWMDICRFEKRVTDALEMQEQEARENWDEAEHVDNRRKQALKRKYLMMGLATAGGGLVIGLSAGLLAPVIGAGLAAGFSAIGVAGTSSFLAGAGGAAIITTSSAIAGGSIAVKASHRRMGAVKTFEYRPLHHNKRVNLILTISGWMNGKVDDVRLPFSTVDPIMGDIYSLHWEPEMLQSMGDTIRILATEALTQGLQQVLASTFLTALMAGLSAPVMLSKLSYLIDNPWSSSLDRAERAGLILADSIIDRHLGVRPITLVGFSLGSRVIFSCLKELVARAAFGLVQNVYVFGSPVVANKEEWLRVRTIVSGRFVSGYASNDWILGYLFRATSGGIQRVAGLAPVEDVPGIENLNCTDLVNGHMAYRAAMPKLLREAGWEVITDEFTEIEDPDPDNHEARQRELIQEIEHARHKAQESEKKRWWGNKKKSQKKGWETYDEKSKEAISGGKGGGDDKGDRNSVLFDIDAIRRELESEHMEVKQLESTLPPMQLKLDNPSSSPQDKSPRPDKPSRNPFAALRGTKSQSATDVSKAPSSKVSSPNPESTEKPKKGVSMYDYDEDEDIDPHLKAGEPSMTFERPLTPPGLGATAAQRPVLKSAATMPVGLGVGGLPVERNAWASEEDFVGEEGEITMSFA